MKIPLLRGGGATQLHHRLRGSAGMVTAEFAFGFLAVIPVMLSMILLLSAAATKIHVVEGARTAARMLARGDDEAAARDAVSAIAPQAEVSVVSYGDSVVVEVAQTMRPAGLLPQFTLTSTAVTPVEVVDDAA